MDGTWLIVPAKPFHQGKSRLQLPLPQRAALNRAFLDHVLTTAAKVVPARRIVVISRDPQALAVARGHDARALPESSTHGLDDALTCAAAHAAARGGTRIVSLFTDLPHLASADIEAILTAGEADRTVVIAADKAGAGTNAMLMPSRLFPYRHGAGSFWRHLSGAHAARHAVSVLRRPGLMTDIDEPAQLPGLPPRFAAAIGQQATQAPTEVFR